MGEAGCSEKRTFAFPVTSAEREFAGFLLVLLVQVSRRCLGHAMARYGPGRNIEFPTSAPRWLLPCVPVSRTTTFTSRAATKHTLDSQCISLFTGIRIQFGPRISRNLTSHMGSLLD